MTCVYTQWLAYFLHNCISRSKRLKMSAHTIASLHNIQWISHKCIMCLMQACNPAKQRSNFIWKADLSLKMQECHTRKSAFNANIHRANKGIVLPRPFSARLNADIQSMQKNCIKTAILCKKQAILGPFYTEYTEMARMQGKPMKCATKETWKKGGYAAAQRVAAQSIAQMNAPFTMLMQPNMRFRYWM